MSAILHILWVVGAWFIAFCSAMLIALCLVEWITRTNPEARDRGEQ